MNLVGQAGLEPAIPWSQTKCDTNFAIARLPHRCEDYLIKKGSLFTVAQFCHHCGIGSLIRTPQPASIPQSVLAGQRHLIETAKYD